MSCTKVAVTPVRRRQVLIRVPIVVFLSFCSLSSFSVSVSPIRSSCRPFSIFGILFIKVPGSPTETGSKNIFENFLSRQIMCSCCSRDHYVFDALL